MVGKIYGFSILLPFIVGCSDLLTSLIVPQLLQSDQIYSIIGQIVEGVIAGTIS